MRAPDLSEESVESSVCAASLHFLIFIIFYIGTNHFCIFQFLSIALIIENDPSLESQHLYGKINAGDIIQSKETDLRIYILISFTTLIGWPISLNKG